MTTFAQAIPKSRRRWLQAARRASHLIMQGGILLTFLLLPVWYRLPASPPLLTPYYSTRFLILLPVLWSIGGWLLLGLPGFSALRKDGRRYPILLLLLLALWALASTRWAFIQTEHPEVGMNAALQFAISALFAVVLACATPRLEHISAALAVGLGWNSALTMAQAARQSALGLVIFGEFPIGLDGGGFSVLLAGDLRWLRPYGLLPHPNLLGGFLVIALLGASLGLFARRPARRWITTVLLIAGGWSLLLTFSRGAWVGAAACILLLPVIWRTVRPDRTLRRHLLLTAALILLTGLVFVAAYRPLLMSRAGVGAERVELRSIADRVVFTRLARQAISEAPLQGVGMGNFPWRSAYYLLETDYDLRGDNVHNVYLLAGAELGIIGLALLVGAWITGVLAFWRHSRGQSANMGRWLFFAGFVALSVVGLVDHYPWTILHFQVAWWGCLVLSWHPLMNQLK